MIFLDSNVFIWGYNRRDSNSGKILELMDEGILDIVTSEKVLQELRKYFLTFYNKDVWSAVLRHITSLVVIIPKEEIKQELKNWEGKIKTKDIERIATVKYLKIDKLIAYDKDFKGFKEYLTPKQFIRKLHLKESPTEY